MRASLPTIRTSILALSLTAAQVLLAAPVHADSPASPPELQRGGTVTGTLLNPVQGGASTSFTINGDGSGLSLNATFSNVQDPNISPLAFVTVWGPLGQVASANPSPAAGAASVVFPTVSGQAYTVMLSIYQALAQSDFTVTAN